MSEETGNNVPATGTETESASTTDTTPASDSAPATDETPKGEEPKQETALDSDVGGKGEDTGTVDDLASFEFDAEFGMSDEEKANSLEVFKTFGVKTKVQAVKLPRNPLSLRPSFRTQHQTQTMLNRQRFPHLRLFRPHQSQAQFPVSALRLSAFRLWQVQNRLPELCL